MADGKIRYDDININKIKKADLRHSLGIVLQDTHLFTGTIKEISVTENWTQRMKKYIRRQNSPMRTDLSTCCQTGMIPT